MIKSGLILWMVASVISQAQHAARSAIDPPKPFERFTIRADSIPGARIAGVIVPAESPARGTLFLLHGWGCSKESLYGWDWIRKELRWNLVLIDFREHGQSTHSRRLCTLGYFEIWDVKAAIDLAEQRGLAAPYAIYGQSLGASIGLRWAGQDARVRGVLAVSPFRNGLDASERFVRASTGLSISLLKLFPRTGQIIKQVDIPASVKSRNDLRPWIMCGQYDIFPVSDQRAILDSSPAPARLKKLFVIPGGGHNHLWSWRGDKTVPSHDQIIREFLEQCR